MIHRSSRQTETGHWKTSMIAIKLCWPMLALCYMCQRTTSYTQISGKQFQIVNGVRSGSGEGTTHTARNMADCALMCANVESCSNFNFGSYQCELMSAAASCRTNATEWIHGHYLTSKYQKGSQKPPQNLKAGCAKYIFTLQRFF